MSMVKPRRRHMYDGATILVIVLVGLIVLRWQGAPIAAAATAVVAATRAAAAYCRRTGPPSPAPRA